MDGILPLWKPKGFTSHDCVSKARGMLRTKKVGHTGTLDPEVEGVLPLCVGKATKIVPFLTDTDKVYEAVVTLGYSTTTEDATGEKVDVENVKPLSINEVMEALASFQGEITQIPPMYSAVKVDGKKLYEYAREGKEVERPSRQVKVKEIRLMDQDIRTLCVDIGKYLGYPAHMSFLVRTKTGEISKEDCFTFEEIQKIVDEDNRESLLLPLSRGLNHLSSWEIEQEMKPKIQHGQVFESPEGISEPLFVVKCDEEVLAIYQQHPSKPGYIKPVRVF
jgi:tRNA pseudouridine55 synthase